MNPHIILFGIAIFLFFLLIHIVIWRIKIPNNDILVLFLILLSISIFTVVVFIQVRIDNVLKNLGESDMCAVILLYFALSFAYIMSYPAIQAISPSLEIMMIIGEKKNKINKKEDIIKIYNENVIFEDRIFDLKKNDLIKNDGGYYKLTLAAKIIINIFILYRKIIGLSFGKG